MNISEPTNARRIDAQPRAHLALFRKCAFLLAIACLPGVAFAQTPPVVTYGPGETTKTLQVSRDQIAGPLRVSVNVTPSQLCGFPEGRAALQDFITRNPARSQAEPIIEQIRVAATSQAASLVANLFPLRTQFAASDLRSPGGMFSVASVNVEALRQGNSATQVLGGSCFTVADARAWILEYVRVLKLYYGIPQ